ncbi:MAG TPA: 50S ribosomal protein L18 [Candidatus Gracilibacteria bacterium]|nr:50S ribosomal protein L18 [Candidatus Gracilibacteria bacterium]
MKTSKKLIDRKRRHMRIRAKISGTPERPRLVVFRSLSHHYAQLIDDTKGVTLASASDIKDRKSKEKRLDRAKQVGLKIAELAKVKNISTCTFDRNGFKYHGRVKAIAEGAREGGLEF